MKIPKKENNTYLFGSIENIKNVENIHDWLLNFLNGKGHSKNLAKVLSEINENNTKLVKIKLDKLKQVAGPSNDYIYPIDPSKWKNTVEKYIKKIKSGEEPLPLVITQGVFDQNISIADGNHRFEALVRCGFKEYYAIYVNNNFKKNIDKC